MNTLSYFQLHIILKTKSKTKNNYVAKFDTKNMKKKIKWKPTTLTQHMVKFVYIANK